MITCQRCGKPAPMGVANCQYCGMVLANTATERPGSSMASSMTPRMAAPEQSQPELPAWLETLRSGERPNASTTGTPNFSSGDDEGMLPSWMRPEGSEIVDNSPSGKYLAQRSASMPGPNTDSAFSPTRGMPASLALGQGPSATATLAARRRRAAPQPAAPPVQSSAPSRGPEGGRPAPFLRRPGGWVPREPCRRGPRRWRA